MNISHQAVHRDTPSEVTIADSLEMLDSIRDPECAAAIFRRQPRPGFQHWIDTLDPATLPRARVVLRPDAIPDALGHIFDIYGLETGAERQWLKADIAGLAHRFSAIMRAPYVRLRLDVVTTNACSKFHIDALFARLVCTYRGTGTQYGLSAGKADPKTVFTLAPCTPIVMRGTLWPAETSMQFLHRSPPIAGTGETRLVLVLDPLFDIEDA